LMQLQRGKGERDRSTSISPEKKEGRKGDLAMVACREGKGGQPQKPS
jgi:hypothetical protein